MRDGSQQCDLHGSASARQSSKPYSRQSGRAQSMTSVCAREDVSLRHLEAQPLRAQQARYSSYPIASSPGRHASTRSLAIDLPLQLQPRPRTQKMHRQHLHNWPTHGNRHHRYRLIDDDKPENLRSRPPRNPSLPMPLQSSPQLLLRSPTTPFAETSLPYYRSQSHGLRSLWFSQPWRRTRYIQYPRCSRPA